MDELIAVTGASGWIGGAVCAWLESKRRSVRRLVRIARSPEEARFDLCDPEHATSWPAALRGCTTLIHCAAHVHRPVETETERAQFETVNAAGTSRLVAACETAGVRRILLASTIAVYDWERPGERGEEDACAPKTAYGRSKLAAEEAVRGWSGDWRIARLATVYGEGDRANFNRLAAALRRKRFILPGKGEARKSVVPLPRAAEILGRLALLEEARGTLMNVAAPEAPSLAEICRAFCVACGFAAPRRMPVGLLGLAARAGNLAAAAGGRAPLTTDVLEKLTSDTVVHTGRMKELFGDLSWEPFAESIRSMAGYYARA